MDKKDLDAIEKLFDKKFLEVEDRLDKKMDTKFKAFELKMDEKMNNKFEGFKKQFSLELFDVLHDMMLTIDYRFNNMEESINQKFSTQDKKIDLLLEYAKDNLHKHNLYDRQFSKIDSKLLNHDLRLNSLEAFSRNAI